MRLDRLLSFLDQDPDNTSLLASGVEAAAETGDLATADRLLDRLAGLGAPTVDLANMVGVASLRQGETDLASRRLETAHAAAPDRSDIRFNLAWARALANDWAGVADLVDAATAVEIPGAAVLRIQALLHLGDPDGALEWGQAAAERRPDDPDLWAALSTAALDAERSDLAGAFAARAGDRPEGLATLGLLALEADDPQAAIGRFDQALAAKPDNGRALLGKGLALMAEGDAPEAGVLLDRATEVFPEHLGTWVAAGWSRFAAGDAAGARRRFEHALAVDDTFAELHGGLAVLDVQAGDLESARRRTDIALRLDPACLSGILARTLLLDQAGDHATAERLRQVALHRPVAPGGRSIAQGLTAMAQRGAVQRKPS